MINPLDKTRVLPFYLQPTNESGENPASPLTGVSTVFNSKLPKFFRGKQNVSPLVKQVSSSNPEPDSRRKTAAVFKTEKTPPPPKPLVPLNERGSDVSSASAAPPFKAPPSFFNKK